MPVIPFVQQGQQLNPSNPVPIAGTSEARLPGENLASFGKSLSQLGSVLMAESSAADRALKLARMKNAVADADGALLEEYTKQRGQAPIMGDADGTKALEGFKQRGNEKIQKILNSLPDDTERASFMAEYKGLVNNYSAKILGDELVKRREAIDIETGKYLSAQGALVRGDATKLDDAFIKSELHLRELVSLGHLTPSEVTSSLQSAKESLLTDAIDGVMAKGDFDSARKIVEVKGAGVFSPDVIRKKANYIDQEEAKYNNKIYNDTIKTERLEAAKLKKVNDKKATLYYAQLSKAGLSMEEREAIFKHIDADVEINGFPLKVARALKMDKTFFEQGDEMFEVGVNELLAQGKISEAREKINNGLGSEVSPKKANELLDKLNRINGAGKTHTTRLTQAISGGSKLIKTMLDDNSPQALADPFSLQQKRQKNAEAIIAYRQRMLEVNDPSKSSEIANEIIEEFYGQKPIIVKGTDTNYLLLQSADGIEKYKKILAIDYGDRIQNNPKDAARLKKEFMQLMEDLEEKKKFIESSNRAKQAVKEGNK